jgi:hypothetical protein
MAMQRSEAINQPDVVICRDLPCRVGCSNATFPRDFESREMSRRTLLESQATGGNRGE